MSGGYIAGPPAVVRMERVGDCRCGFPLYRIAGGSPEHILTEDMIWRWRLGMLACAANYDPNP